MKKLLSVLLLIILSCKSTYQKPSTPQDLIVQKQSDFVIAFGSGNDQLLENPFWEQLTVQKPDVWIWGGDNIYFDTEDMELLKANYQLQKNNYAYQNFQKTTTIIGTWDDHDYGMNDGGAEYPMKKESQQLLLDFLNVDKNDVRRTQEGVYFSSIFEVNKATVKIIVLDTRYFRSALTPDKKGKKRYLPNQFGEGTMLGETQWNWLNKELSTSTAQFNIIVSSIQVLSNQHGFECWGNFPHEVEKLEKIIVESKAKGVFLLSGDRHISEISSKNIGDENFPLVDFTSSGLTHSYKNFSGEENPYRKSKVVFEKSYGIVRLNFKSNAIEMEMWGENNKILERYSHQFKN